MGLDALLSKAMKRNAELEKEALDGLERLQEEGRRIERWQDLRAVSDYIAFTRPWKSKKVKME
jgi:hypothetical protein